MTIYIIYEIRPLNKELIFSYVGSTLNFRNRKYQHKKDCNNINSTNHSVKLYQFIRNNGGFNEFEMIPLEEYECDRKTQSRIREQFFINQIENKLNMKKAFISTEETKEYMIEYRLNNKKQMKKYRNDNKETIKLQVKEYYEKHKELIIEQNKTNYKNKKEIIKKQRKEKILCLCGKEFRKSDKIRHERSKKHLNYLEQLNKKEIITECIDA
jgi:hypothetical protein